MRLRKSDPAAEAPIPVDLITASASGLDPHISPAAALYQAPRVAAARKLDEQAMLKLIEEHTEGRQFGLLGEPRVNVLKLNLALDGLRKNRPMTDERPNPDAVLAQVQAEEERARRGKLKLFFGFAAGVGKTYTMMETARRDVSAGRDVLVGVVETHGRSETAALLLGMDLLPLKEIDHRGVKLKEFDLDAALELHPELVIVDELAHTNAPGSRHAKRWQDVEELLDAGIDVYTTLNVQHLESLNDVVAQITGVVVQETVPDAVLERADEVELVDLPPENLLERFRAGRSTCRRRPNTPCRISFARRT